MSVWRGSWHELLSNATISEPQHTCKSPQNDILDTSGVQWWIALLNQDLFWLMTNYIICWWTITCVSSSTVFFLILPYIFFPTIISSHVDPNVRLDPYLGLCSKGHLESEVILVTNWLVRVIWQLILASPQGRDRSQNNYICRDLIM